MLKYLLILLNVTLVDLMCITVFSVFLKIFIYIANLFYTLIIWTQIGLIGMVINAQVESFGVFLSMLFADAALCFMLFFFTLIYSFIFIILRMEDFALLVGSFGLVLVLGLCMYLSRKVDWYNIKSSKDRRSYETA